LAKKSGFGAVGGRPHYMSALGRHNYFSSSCCSCAVGKQCMSASECVYYCVSLNASCSRKS